MTNKDIPAVASRDGSGKAGSVVAAASDVRGRLLVDDGTYRHPQASDGHPVSVTIDNRVHNVEVDARESLWETMVYRLGLAGANLGCDRAQCGICNVVLDGRAVNSCAILTARVSGRKVETVAGLAGEPGVAGLHPLQRAFWDTGAFQCGICTKGFIMSAYALLAKTPDPSEAEIERALAGVLCRCGERARIVAAVERAAAEMRGDMPPRAVPSGDAPAYRGNTLMPSSSNVLGTRVPRIHGIGSVTPLGEYLSLMRIPGMVFLRSLRSPYPRARVVAVDASRAEMLPGVLKVLHRFNVPPEYMQKPMEAPPPRYLMNEIVTQVGQPVAVVAAESEHVADDALELIDVTYEVLEPALDYLDADHAAPQWDNELPGTVKHVHGPVEVGNVAEGFGTADVVVEHTTTTPTEQHVPLELRTGIYYWDADVLVTYQTTHRTFDTRRELARWLGLPEEKVRVVQTGFMGSSYGSADQLVEELVLPAVMAKVTGLPVRAMLTREESFLTSAHRGRTRTRVKIGARRTGRLTALDVDVVYDGGTNAGTPASAAAARGLTGVGVRGGWYPFQILYTNENQRYYGKEVFTNSFRAGPMRGVGRHFGLFALETAMEKAAFALGMDPLELRLANLNETGALFDEITAQRPGLPFGRVGGQRQSLLRAAELIGWGERRRGPRANEVRRGVFRGLGIVSTIDRGGGRQGGAPPEAPPPPSTAQLELGPDGVLEVFSGSTEVGSGQRTLMAMIAAQSSGIPLDQIVISPGVDTGVNTDTGPTNSSLQTNVAGWAVLEAASLLRDRLADLAAKHFSDEHGVDVTPDDISVRDGEAYSEDDPDRRVRVEDLARRAGEPVVTKSERRRRLTAESVATGAHAVEVEVDTRTGGVRVLHYVAVHDVGRVLNRLALEQQVEGGVVMGLGSTLHEELILDHQTGLPLNPTILDYKPPSILEVPRFSIDFVEVPQDYGPYGAVAIGQASTPPVAPVIANAVHDAVGIWVGDIPFSPNRLLAALTPGTNMGAEAPAEVGEG